MLMEGRREVVRRGERGTRTLWHLVNADPVAAMNVMQGHHRRIARVIRIVHSRPIHSLRAACEQESTHTLASASLALLPFTRVK